MSWIKLNSDRYTKMSLKKFVKLFANSKVRYEYCVDCHVHTIEILPSGLHQEVKFSIWLNKFYSRFKKKYPNELLYIISCEDAVAGIGKTYEEYIGENYKVSGKYLYTKYNCKQDNINSGYGVNAQLTTSF